LEPCTQATLLQREGDRASNSLMFTLHKDDSKATKKDISDMENWQEPNLAFKII
jgi:hypothetical protein